MLVSSFGYHLILLYSCLVPGDIDPDQSYLTTKQSSQVATLGDVWVPCAQPAREAWKPKVETPDFAPCLCRDLTSWLFQARRALDLDAEKRRPDAGKGPEGHVCHATPQSISELRGTVPRRHWAPPEPLPSIQAHP